MVFIDVFLAASYFNPALIIYFIVALFALYVGKRFILSIDYSTETNPDHERKLQKKFASFLEFPTSVLLALGLCFAIGIYSNYQRASHLEIEKAIACVNKPNMEYSRMLLKDEFDRAVVRKFKVSGITQYCDNRYKEIQVINQNKSYSKQLIN